MPRFTRRITSRGYEMDARQRVSPGTLARYMEHARWEAIASGALGMGELFATGLKIVVRAQDLWFGAAAVHGTEVELSATLARVGNSSFTLMQWAHRLADGAELARNAVTAVALGADGRPARVPDVVRAKCEQLEVEPSPSFEDTVPERCFERAVGVRASDLDTLLHVNQSRYVEYADDTRALAFFTGALTLGELRHDATPRRISVDYRRETKLGQELIAALWVIDPTQRVLGCALRDAADGGVNARARIEL